MLYQYWTKNLSLSRKQNLQKALENIVIAGHLAPSSHNTQPWLFKISPPKIEIYKNPKRRLSVADPTNREMHISIGCAMQNMLLATQHFQLKSTVTFFPSKNKDHIATIECQRSGQIRESTLFPYIQKRVTNRSLYKKWKSLPLNFYNEIKKTIESKSAQIKFFTDQNIISKMADITKKGIHTALSNPNFTQELAKTIRHPWTKVGFGMTTNTMGIPDEFSFIAQAIVSSPDMASETSQSEWKMVNSAPVIGIIHTKNDSQEDWIEAGMTYQLLALVATKHKISTALLSAAVEVPEQRKALSKATNLEHPMMFARIGYATKKFPHSQRSHVNDVLIV